MATSPPTSLCELWRAGRLRAARQARHRREGKIVSRGTAIAGAGSSRRSLPSTARSAASSIRIRATTGFRGQRVSEGPWRPEHGVQRGSVIDMPVQPGDPLSPGWASEPGGRSSIAATPRRMMKIPVLPISYADALPLLKQSRRSSSPPDVAWRPSGHVSHRTGPREDSLEARVRLAGSPLYNVDRENPGYRVSG